MFRRYNRKHSRFDQPDPYDGSYNLTDPQSFNRYAYVQNDPVNFVDPSGLNMAAPNCYMVLDAGEGGFRFGMFSQHWVCTTESVDSGRRGPPDLEPGDGGGTAPQNPTLNPSDLDRLKNCVSEIYGVEFTSFSAANGNQLGAFQGSGYNRYTGRTGGIQVLTNASSFSSSQLATMNNDYASRYPDKHQPMVGPGERVLGATFSFGMAGVIQVSPYVNYLANDPPAFASSPAVRLVLQVHELGHSLADITGKGKGERGMQLEDCVFRKL